MAEPESPFAVQKDVRVPWRKYLDELAPLRPDLHRYCVRLTGNVWDGEDLINMIGPLWGEADETKRIDGWKAVDRYIAENALVIPLLQYVQPILHAPGVVVTPHASGSLLPHLMKRA